MKSVAFLTGFYNLNGTLSIRKSFFKHFAKNFKKIYIVDIDQLIFFPKFSKISYGETKKIEKINQKIPSNVQLIKPRNTKEFMEFAKKNNLLVINNFTKNFFALKIFLLIKKLKIPQIRIDNLGAIGMPTHIEAKNPIRWLNYHLFQNLFKKIITPLLMLLGLIPRIDIHFHSKKKELMQAKKSFFRGFLLKHGLLFAKEYKIINSRSYDALLENKTKIEKNYIVHLDAEMNGRHEIETRGILKAEDVKAHYYHLRVFLNKLSKDFNKPVVVCIHPSIKKRELSQFRKSGLLKGFKIVQHQTIYYIYKSFIVTSFDTSAVSDAAILKKNMIGLWSKYMDINQIKHSKTFPKVIGYLRINLENFKYDKKQLNKTLNKNTSKYDNYNKNYHCHKKNTLGINEVILTIKKRYKCI